MKLFNKGAEEPNKAKKAAEDLDAAMQELDEDAVNKIAGGGIFDDVPPVVEHPYDPNDSGRY